MIWPKIIKLFLSIGLIGLGFFAVVMLYSEESAEEANYVNVYNWYGVIPSEVLKQFETETGITIRYDLFDNNEVVEAKLFSGNSGYDVIFPSASPYVVRHIHAGVYQKLNKDLLPNLKYIDSRVNDKIRFADPSLEYAIAYYWGTYGFLYVEEEVLKRLPEAPVLSYRMLFDPEVVSKFSDCGITLLDEAVDVYPAMLAYLGMDPQSSREEDLAEAQKHLLKIRSYIKRFSSLRFLNEVVSGESCVAQAWSGDAHAAQEKADEVGRDVRIKYVVPEEGGSMWIDCMVIPKGAPHPKNAHKFINFLLRPDIGAKISNASKMAIANKQAMDYIEDSIRNDETIYPRDELLKKLRLDKPQSLAYDRLRTRYWTQFRAGKI